MSATDPLKKKKLKRAHADKEIARRKDLVHKSEVTTLPRPVLIT